MRFLLDMFLLYDRYRALNICYRMLYFFRKPVLAGVRICWNQEMMSQRMPHPDR